MGLKLSRQQHQQLLEWASEAGEHECCGLLLGEGNNVLQIELTTNVTDDPQMRFEIDPMALIRAEKQARQGGLKILGYFHSHPNGRAEPSAEDAACAIDDGRYWLIVANGEITSWRATGRGNGQPVTFVAKGPV